MNPFLLLKVALQNRLNVVANEVYPLLYQHLKNFSGKAYKKDGTKTSVFEKYMETFQFPTFENVRITFFKSYDSLILKITVESFGDNYISRNNEFYLGRAKDGYLNLYEDRETISMKTDYSAEQIQKACEEIEELKKKIETIEKENNLHLFH